MLRIDKAILDTNGVICDNVSQLSFCRQGASKPEYSWSNSQLRGVYSNQSILQWSRRQS